MNTPYVEDDYLLLSGVQHFAFCKRQWGLIHIEQQWLENQSTTEGHLMHERAHDQTIHNESIDLVVTRSMWLTSKQLGLYGIADVVEFFFSKDSSKGIQIPDKKGYWIPHPVEYKKGKPKTDDRDQVQVCAQAICLEEMLEVSIEYGDLFYGQTKHREKVVFTKSLRERVMSLSNEMHEIFQQGITPIARYEKKCKYCSLLHLCNPKILMKRSTVEEYIHSMANQVESKQEETDSEMKK